VDEQSVGGFNSRFGGWQVQASTAQRTRRIARRRARAYRCPIVLCRDNRGGERGPGMRPYRAGRGRKASPATHLTAFVSRR
jgi:hypothetical protein